MFGGASISAMSPIFLSLLLSLPHLSSSQGVGFESGNCPMITAADLGDTTSPSDAGLISGAVEAPVQILEFNLVCLGSGDFNNTYRYASLVVRYIQAGGERIDQFTMFCDDVNMWRGVEIRLEFLLADLTTPLRTDCQECVDPSIAIEQRTVRYDNVTHCSSESSMHLASDM